jgi:hypothetical protein
VRQNGKNQQRHSEPIEQEKARHKITWIVRETTSIAVIKAQVFREADCAKAFQLNDKQEEKQVQRRRSSRRSTLLRRTGTGLDHRRGWVKSRGVQRLSDITKRGILDAQENLRFVGRLDLAEFMKLVGISWSGDVLTEVGQGPSGLFTENPLYSYFGTGQPGPRTPLSNTQFLKDCGFLTWPDTRVQCYAGRNPAIFGKATLTIDGVSARASEGPLVVPEQHNIIDRSWQPHSLQRHSVAVLVATTYESHSISKMQRLFGDFVCSECLGKKVYNTNAEVF